MNIIQLIPIVVDAIKAVEQMLPQGSGQEKLAAVIATVESIYGALGDALPSLTNFIAVVVKGLNAVGLFKRKVG